MTNFSLASNLNVVNAGRNLNSALSNLLHFKLQLIGLINHHNVKIAKWSRFGCVVLNLVK